MGSTGSGNFGDYTSGDGSRCHQPVETELEDVAQSGYYQSHHRNPAANSPVQLESKPVNGRLVVKDAATGLVVGVLPTKYNYLLACQGSGIRYEGEVTQARAGAVPSIRVKLEPV